MTNGGDRSHEHRLIVAGFGGQGVLTLGRLLCQAVMSEGKQVTCLPSYGSEVRGGTANCNVVISRDDIYNTVVEEADSLIILNRMSFERFGDALKRGGLLVLNTSMVHPGDYGARRGVRAVEVPATEMAGGLGNVVVANVIMLGAYATASQLCAVASARSAVEQMLAGRKHEVLDLNLKALAAGAALGA